MLSCPLVCREGARLTSGGEGGGDPDRTGLFSSLAGECSRGSPALTRNVCGPENGTNAGSGSGLAPGRVIVITAVLFFFFNTMCQVLTLCIS